MKKLVCYTLVLFALFILVAHPAFSQDDEEDKAPSVGKPLPKFTFTTIDGKEDKVENYLGKKPLIVNFWGSWCPPCRKEVPELRTFFNNHKKDGLTIVSLAVNDNIRDMKAFMKKEPMPWIHALDDGLFRKWGYRGVPTNVFVGKDGNVISVKVGSLTLEELKEFEDELFPKEEAKKAE